MMSRRGVYRCIYAAMLEDGGFLALTPHARLVLLTLRLCPQNTVASLFRCYATVLADQTGLPLRLLRRAMAELVTRRWVELDGPAETFTGPCLVWIRHGLKYDPYLRLADAKHRIGVERAIAAFGDAPIVARFRDYYGLSRPSEDPTETLGRPFEDPMETLRRPCATSTTPTPTPRTRTTPSTTPSPRTTTPDEPPEGFSPPPIGHTEDGRSGPDEMPETLAAIMARREELRRAKGYAP